MIVVILLVFFTEIIHSSGQFSQNSLIFLILSHNYCAPGAKVWHLQRKKGQLPISFPQATEYKDWREDHLQKKMNPGDCVSKRIQYTVLYNCDKVRTRGQFIETKRTEGAEMINAYSPASMRFCKANNGCPTCEW